MWKSNKQKPQLNRAQKPERELPCPRTKAESNKKSFPLLSWQGLSQWKATDSAYCSPPKFFFLSIKASSFSCHVAHHCTILCSSWINPSWPEKYLAVSLFQINILVACVGTRDYPHSSVAGKQIGAVSNSWAHCHSLLFPLSLALESTSFSWVQAHTHFAFEAL